MNEGSDFILHKICFCSCTYAKQSLFPREVNPFNPSFESSELRCRRGRGHETGKGILTSSSTDKLQHGDVCLRNNFLLLTAGKCLAMSFT